MLWVERDLAAICKAIFDQWESKKAELHHQYFFAANGRWTYDDTVALIEKGKSSHTSTIYKIDPELVTGKPCKYVRQETSGFPERDKLFRMYNQLGTTYPGFVSPDPSVLTLGVELASLEDFIRERLIPSLEPLEDVMQT